MPSSFSCYSEASSLFLGSLLGLLFFCLLPTLFFSSFSPPPLYLLSLSHQQTRSIRCPSFSQLLSLVTLIEPAPVFAWCCWERSSGTTQSLPRERCNRITPLNSRYPECAQCLENTNLPLPSLALRDNIQLQSQFLEIGPKLNTECLAIPSRPRP